MSAAVRLADVVSTGNGVCREAAKQGARLNRSEICWDIAVTGDAIRGDGAIWEFVGGRSGCLSSGEF